MRRILTFFVANLVTSCMPPHKATILTPVWKTGAHPPSSAAAAGAAAAGRAAPAVDADMAVGLRRKEYERRG